MPVREILRRQSWRAICDGEVDLTPLSARVNIFFMTAAAQDRRRGGIPTRKNRFGT